MLLVAWPWGCSGSEYLLKRGGQLNSTYVGNELDLFSNALHWKAYWSGLIKPYLGRSILDVGAGIGSTAKLLSQVEFESYLALEPDDSLVRRMRDDSAAGGFPESFKPVVGTINSLAPGQCFDSILYIDVLEHIAEDLEELERAASHLLPGGRILVLSPAHQWLFTEFDAAIGHVRRYNRQTLLAAKPAGLVVEKLFYLDSVGMLASLGNRLLLRASSPTIGQIRLWDNWMVPASRIVDRVSGFAVGKSIVASFQKRS